MAAASTARAVADCEPDGAAVRDDPAERDGDEDFEDDLVAVPVGPARVGADDDAGFDPPEGDAEDEPLPAGCDVVGVGDEDALGAGRRGARGANFVLCPRFSTAAAPGFSFDVPAVNPQTFPSADPPSG